MDKRLLGITVLVIALLAVGVNMVKAEGEIGGIPVPQPNYIPADFPPDGSSFSVPIRMVGYGIDLTTKNVGNAAATITTTTAYSRTKNGYKTHGEEYVPALGVGEEYTTGWYAYCTSSQDSPGDVFVFSMYVDVYHQLQESSETDNHRQFTVTCTA